MFLRIENLVEKKLVGKSIIMTNAKNRTIELWKSFMPYKKEIKNTIGSELYAMQIYDKNLNFQSFTAESEFEQWAAIEVQSFTTIPTGMKTHTLGSGLYAIFTHKGLPSDFHKTMQYIFREWMPSSKYSLDNREHFQVMGEKYKNNDANSEEEVWIPISLN